MKRYTAILLTAAVQASLAASALAAQYTLTLVDAKIVGGPNDGLSTALINEGASVTITPVVPAGKEFDGWASPGDGLDWIVDSTVYPAMVQMPGHDITISAKLQDVYTVTMVHGTILDPKETGYWYQDHIQIKASESFARPFANWTVAPEGAAVLDDPSAETTTAMILGNCTITANYVVHLTVTNGTGTGWYAPNTQQTISATVPAGQVFAGWTGDTATVQNVNSATTQILMTGDLAVTATFKSQYQLIVDGVDKGKFVEGTDAAIAVTVPAGKVFTGWIGDTATVADVNSANTTVKMNGNVSVQSTFKSLYQLTVTGGAGSGAYVEGFDAPIVATVPTGKTFDRWIGVTGSVANVTSASTTVKMTGHVTLTATFKNLFRLTVNGGTGGGDFVEGSMQSITANAAADGQVFDKWVGDVALVANANAATTSVLMSRPVTVTATYKSTQTNNNNNPNDTDTNGTTNDTDSNGTDNPAGQDVPQDTSTNQQNGQQAPGCGLGILPGAGMTIAGLLCLSLTQRRRSF